MAYSPRTWLDRAVQFATRYTKSGETSGGVTLTADPGVITQAGTPVNAANLNQMEIGIRDAHVTADNALSRINGGTMTGLITTKSPPTGSIASNSGQSNSIEVKGLGGVNDAAYMSFHRPGSFAAHFGLDIDNKWKVGGWSMGSNSYELWHDGRMRIHSSGDYVEWFNGNRGAWQPMGDIQVGKLRSASGSNTSANTFVTVLNVVGSGRLELAHLRVAQSASYTGTLKVTIDGVLETFSAQNLGGSVLFVPFIGTVSPPNNGITQAQEPIYFYSSLKVEVTSDSSLGVSTAYVEYRMKLGTP